MKLLIVESPAKAKKIQSLLGSGWTVRACLDHVRDLPWAHLGVGVEDNYAPLYVIREGKHKTIQELKAAAKGAEQVLLASDPDREGEAVAWHLAVLLGLGKKAQRVTSQEITERALRQAIAHPRPIDYHLVGAQETRRVLDRLAGYGVSPLLWSAVGGNQSAGRVQSAALMLLSQREQSRLAFVPSAYWRVTVRVDSRPAFRATVVALRDVPLATASSFTPQGELKPDVQVVQLDAEKAEQLRAYLGRQRGVVQAVEVTPIHSQVPGPLHDVHPATSGEHKIEAGCSSGHEARADVVRERVHHLHPPRQPQPE